MNLTSPQDLAHSLVFFHGTIEALVLAHRYAEKCRSKSDYLGFTKWNGAAVVLGALIDAEKRGQALDRHDHQMRGSLQLAKVAGFEQAKM